MSRYQLGQRNAGTVLKCYEQVAPRRGIVRFQLQCAAISGDRIIDLPLLSKNIAQVVIKVRSRPFQFDRSTDQF